VGVRVGRAGTPEIEAVAERIADGKPAFIATVDAEHAAPGSRAGIAARLATAAAAVLARVRPDLIVATGGETAVALLRAIGASRVDICGAPASGLALGEAVQDRGGSTIPLLTKAGGFGAPDLFTDLLSTGRQARAGMAASA
jgi:uncharacterized protein YgbK (DUF1537 family)